MQKMERLENVEQVRAYLVKRDNEGSAMERVLMAALENGWDIKVEPFMRIFDIRRRTKEVRVYFDVTGRVIESGWSTRTKARRFIGKDQAGQTVAYLAN